MASKNTIRYLNPCPIAQKKVLFKDMKIKTLTLICILTIGISTFSISAQRVISEKTQTAIDDFMQFRMELSLYEKPEQALQAIEEYHNKHFSDAELSGFTEQEKLILSNFEVLEKYNYMYFIPELKEDNIAMLKAQYEYLTTWIKEHKNEELNKWLYTTAGDLLSCNLAYTNIGTILHDGLAVKNYYEKAIEQDPNMSYALTNIAQWFYYAPAISGGGKSRAQNYFTLGLEAAKNNAETYYAKIFLSQSLFEDKKTREASATMLAEAGQLMPGSHYIDKLQRINKAGYSLYYFNTHQDDLKDKI